MYEGTEKVEPEPDNLWEYVRSLHRIIENLNARLSSAETNLADHERMIGRSSPTPAPGLLDDYSRRRGF